MKSDNLQTSLDALTREEKDRQNNISKAEGTVKKLKESMTTAEDFLQNGDDVDELLALAVCVLHSRVR
jgi:hypothetical protein